MRVALVVPCCALVGGLLILGGGGTVMGSQLAIIEKRKAPPVLAAVALMILTRGPRALPAAAGWALAGLAAAVAWRAAAGLGGANGWIPGETMPRWEAVAEAAWLAVLAAAAWCGVPARITGPLLAVVIATTRIGAFGEALRPVLWEDSAKEALAIGIPVGAGLVMGVLVVLLLGWGVSVLARIPEKLVRPGRTLAVLAGAAALARGVGA